MGCVMMESIVTVKKPAMTRVTARWENLHARRTNAMRMKISAHAQQIAHIKSVAMTVVAEAAEIVTRALLVWTGLAKSVRLAVRVRPAAMTGVAEAAEIVTRALVV